jgi:hypothetical protein
MVLALKWCLEAIQYSMTYGHSVCSTRKVEKARIRQQSPSKKTQLQATIHFLFHLAFIRVPACTKRKDYQEGWLRLRPIHLAGTLVVVDSDKSGVADFGTQEFDEVLSE